MKVKVVEDECVGCGYCEANCPEVFEVDSCSHVKVDTVLDEYKDKVIEAMEGCPTGAIKEVESQENK